MLTTLLTGGPLAGLFATLQDLAAVAWTILEQATWVLSRFFALPEFWLSLVG